jgi:hypothetical protein
VKTRWRCRLRTCVRAHRATQDRARLLTRGHRERTLVNTVEAWHTLHGAVAAAQGAVTLPAMVRCAVPRGVVLGRWLTHARSGQVSADPACRAAATRAKAALQAAWDAEYSRPDLYALFHGTSIGGCCVHAGARG